MKYCEVTDVEEMLPLGITNVPVLSVDGTMMEFSSSVNWINNQEEWQ